PTTRRARASRPRSWPTSSASTRRPTSAPSRRRPRPPRSSSTSRPRRARSRAHRRPRSPPLPPPPRGRRRSLRLAVPAGIVLLGLETGYGLEGALPDATAHRIIDETIVPAFRSGDYAGGIEAGVDAMMAATRGEYRARPTPTPRAAPGGSGLGGSFFLVLLVLFFVIAISNRRRGRTYGRRGWYGG